MNFEAENDIVVIVSFAGTIRWYQHGKWHREDGPAVVYTNGYKHWFRNGLYHREDGPAIEYPDGSKVFSLEDEYYEEKTYWKRINEF